MCSYQDKNDLDSSVILQFLGDISLNGLFCEPQYQFELAQNMSELPTALGECDLRIGNLESPLWGDGGVNVLRQPRLCTTADAAKCILKILRDDNLTTQVIRAAKEKAFRYFDVSVYAQNIEKGYAEILGISVSFSRN